VTGLLVTELARADTLAWLQTYLPAAIAGVNQDRPTASPLVDIATWSGTALVATPEPPAVYVLPQSSGFRGTQWPVVLDEEHLLSLYVQVGNQDEETLQTDLTGYVAALCRCVVLWAKGQAPFANGEQILFGHGGADANDIIVYGPTRPTADGPFYADAFLNVTVLLSEVP
jgi:hypothetical protein